MRYDLTSIEWGGDIHVPHGNMATAAEVGELTRSAGLSIAAYGSYYRLASPCGSDFPTVLATALALQAPVIRIWAGSSGSRKSSAWHRKAVVEDALRCADLAGSRGICLAYEFHERTLTDTTESALELLDRTAHPFIKTLWQPPHGQPLESCLASLRAILPRLQHIHVFHWWPDSSCRRPLAEGRNRWQAYATELRRQEVYCPLLLEFVRNDDPALLAEDAAVLRQLSVPSDT